MYQIFEGPREDFFFSEDNSDFFFQGYLRKLDRSRGIYSAFGVSLAAVDACNLSLCKVSNV